MARRERQDGLLALVQRMGGFKAMLEALEDVKTPRMNRRRLDYWCYQIFPFDGQVYVLAAAKAKGISPAEAVALCPELAEAASLAERWAA